MFANVYAGKRVVVTGHTGFKGTWLTAWLLALGAKVCGISKDVPTSPSAFDELDLQARIEHHFEDICNLAGLRDIIERFQPDYVFHLAAQAIVSRSYQEPLDTISTNIVGTAHVLEALRGLAKPCVAILISSDKCYENVEWPWGYRETDHLGGKDIYSGSKGAAEIVIHAYQQSFFKSDDGTRVASARAGNVIGGGDWAEDRIVADCMRAWNKGDSVLIRRPNATRPWQHVLEPLSGYLALGQALADRPALNGEPFNFGPRAEQNRTVLELLAALSDQWGFTNADEAYRTANVAPFHEAGLLKVNCDKAVFHLKWQPTLDFAECVEFVADWYLSFYKRKANMFDFTARQIAMYCDKAAQRSLAWAQ